MPAPRPLFLRLTYLLRGRGHSAAFGEGRRFCYREPGRGASPSSVVPRRAAEAAAEGSVGSIASRSPISTTDGASSSLLRLSLWHIRF
jgi:hypothetical protein